MAGWCRQLGRDRIPALSLGKPVLAGVQSRAERAGEFPRQAPSFRRFGAKPCKNFVDDQAARPSSWKTPFTGRPPDRPHPSLRAAPNPTGLRAMTALLVLRNKAGYRAKVANGLPCMWRVIQQNDRVFSLRFKLKTK